MSKEKPTRENVFDLQPYKSILNLILHFKSGLAPKYIRYALIRGNDRENFDKKTYTDLEAFYNKKNLNDLYNRGIIEEDIVTSKYSLSNFLHTLNRLDIIYKSGKKYKIRKTYRNGIIKGVLQQNISFFNNREVISFERGDSPIGVLLGIGIRWTYKSLTDTEKREVRFRVKEANKILLEIDKIFSTRRALGYYKIIEDDKGKLPEDYRKEKEEVLKNIEEGLMLDTLTFVRQPFYSLLKKKKGDYNPN